MQNPQLGSSTVNRFPKDIFLSRDTGYRQTGERTAGSAKVSTAAVAGFKDQNPASPAMMRVQDGTW